MVQGKMTPLHVHPEAHEVTLFLEGEIDIVAGGHRAVVRAGGMHFVPRGVEHAFVVLSPVARLVAFQSPGAVGQAFYRAASEPAADDRADIVDLARLQAAAAANPRGIRILGPPPFLGERR